MAKAILVVPDIECEHCEHAINEALGPVPGVRTVKVDIDAHKVELDYDDLTRFLTLKSGDAGEGSAPDRSFFTLEANSGVCAMRELLKICRRSDRQLPRSWRRLEGFITMADACPRSPPVSAWDVQCDHV